LAARLGNLPWYLPGASTTATRPRRALVGNVFMGDTCAHAWTPTPARGRQADQDVGPRAPSFKSQFYAAAEQRGLTPADAHREAVKDWVTNVSPDVEEA